MFPLVATGVFLIIAPYFVKLLGLTVDGDATNPDLKADTKEHRAPACNTFCLHTHVRFTPSFRRMKQIDSKVNMHAHADAGWPRLNLEGQWLRYSKFGKAMGTIRPFRRCMQPSRLFGG